MDIIKGIITNRLFNFWLLLSYLLVKILDMKKRLIILLSCLLLTIYNVTAQEIPSTYDTYGSAGSQWELGKNHKLSLNYNLFGKSVSQGLWKGSLGYATGMWLSGNNTNWGMVGSVLAVNIPLLLDKGYETKEVWIGNNVGALSVSLSFTFAIEMHRNGKASWNLQHWLVKRY